MMRIGDVGDGYVALDGRKGKARLSSAGYPCMTGFVGSSHFEDCLGHSREEGSCHGGGSEGQGFGRDEKSIRRWGLVCDDLRWWTQHGCCEAVREGCSSGSFLQNGSTSNCSFICSRESVSLFLVLVASTKRQPNRRRTKMMQRCPKICN